MVNYYGSENNALWLQEKCGERLIFLGCHDVNDQAEPTGELTMSRQRVSKGDFRVIRVRRSIPDLPTATVRMFRSDFNLLTDLPCPPNLYIMYSNCGADEDKTNYAFFDLYEGVFVTAKNQAAVVKAIAPDGETESGADIIIEAPIQFFRIITHKVLASTQVTVSNVASHTINDIAICDKEASCGECDDYTVGCQTIWFVTDGVTGSIGTPAAIRKSTDRGQSWTNITNPFSDTDDTIVAVKCVGNTVILVNGDTSAYAYSSDGLTFTEVETPTQIISKVAIVGETNIWFAAASGYVYYSSDGGASVSTQTNGSVTAQNLNDISFADSLLGYTAGNLNAFMKTTDGGTWEAVTGPSVGINLMRVKAIPNTDIVFVGDASGNVFRSDDNGTTWETSLAASSSTSGGIRGIAACNCNIILVGANNASGDGVLRKSIDGGDSWEAQTVDTNSGINAVECCDVNEYWLAGDLGFIARVSGPSFRDEL